MGKFGNILIELRKEAGLTQAELAQRVGISRGAIGNYEKGIREPDFETLEKIADYFNVPMGQLLGDKKDDNAYYAKYRQRAEERELLEMFRRLNSSGQEKVKDYMKDLVSLEKYTAKKGSSSHSAG